jgi:hypothetical protein
LLGHNFAHVVKAADPRAERFARNESFFREVNERINRLSEMSSGLPTEYTCECANVDCTERFHVSASDYEAVRAQPAWFLVAPRHLDLEVEEVVTEHPGYWVVRKRGVAGDVAREIDPRS